MASASAMPPSRLAGFCCAAAIGGVGDEGGGRGAAEEVVVMGVERWARESGSGRVSLSPPTVGFGVLAELLSSSNSESPKGCHLRIEEATL